ncbi:MAG: hypothetical protein ACE5IZ_06085 [Dehalococcoidia bacterium]
MGRLHPGATPDASKAGGETIVARRLWDEEALEELKAEKAMPHLERLA